MDKYYKKWFWFLIFPALFFFVFIIGIPFIIGVVYSFTSWKGTYFTGGTVWESFIGIENYAKAFGNKQFLHSLRYTTLHTVVAVVIINVAAFSMALMLHNIKKGVGFFRTTYFMPNMLGGLAMGFVWQFIFEVIFTDLLFSPDGLFHLEFMRYMTQDTYKAIFAIVIMTAWQSAGYMMLIYIGGLNSIPKDMDEAAAIDGANGVTRFFKITLPLLMPSITIVLFLTLANAFKLLDANIALTDGDFNTRMIALQIIRTLKDTSPPDYGLAQAEAVIFFVIVASITLIQVVITRRQEVEM